MAGARRSAAPAASKRGRESKTASAHPAAEKALLFSLDRARFEHVRTRLQVVSVVVPLSHLKSKQAVYDLVLKKVLHRPFAMDESSGTASAPATTKITRVLSTEDKAPEPGDEPAPTAAVSSALAECDMVVHVGKMEVQADSARQVNAAGDVQLNVMTTLVVARVHHGLIVGASSPSDFTECVTVTLPSVPHTDAAQASSVEAAVAASASTEEATNTSLQITVRCLEDEPVVPGQSVLVVSEPGGTIRCLAVRPPRRAPGPFYLVAGGDPHDAFHTPASQVRIECDIPAAEEGTDGSDKKKKKFPKTEAGRAGRGKEATTAE